MISTCLMDQRRSSMLESNPLQSISDSVEIHVLISNKRIISFVISIKHTALNVGASSHTAQVYEQVHCSIKINFDYLTFLSNTQTEIKLTFDAYGTSFKIYYRIGNHRCHTTRQRENGEFANQLDHAQFFIDLWQSDQFHDAVLFREAHFVSGFQQCFYLREEQPILISLPWIQDLLKAALLQEHICRCSTTILCHVVVRFLWTWSGTLLQLFMSSKQQDSLVHSNSIGAITTEGLCPSLFTNDSLTINGYGTTALQWGTHDFNLAHLDGWRNYALTDQQRIIRIIDWCIDVASTAKAVIMLCVDAVS